VEALVPPILDDQVPPDVLELPPVEELAPPAIVPTVPPTPIEVPPVLALMPPMATAELPPLTWPPVLLLVLPGPEPPVRV
jgi:hypothetical protein